MLIFFKRLFVENIALKIMALFLALILWFYIVNELKKGTEEEMQLLSRILPSEGVVAKKLSIRPIVVGKPRWGFGVVPDKILVSPEYCIVVGSRDMLDKIKAVYTMPVDVSGSYKTITRSVSLNPIAPGVYMEETAVQITVPIEKR